jgi:hypothetical protein
MKTLTVRSPRRSVWWIVAALAVVATAVVHALTGSWRGVTVGGVSIVGLLACAISR